MDFFNFNPVQRFKSHFFSYLPLRAVYHKINAFQRKQHPRMFCLVLTQTACLRASCILCPSLMLFSRATSTHNVQISQQRECHVPCCPHPRNRRQSQLPVVCNLGQNPSGGVSSEMFLIWIVGHIPRICEAELWE